MFRVWIKLCLLLPGNAIPSHVHLSLKHQKSPDSFRHKTTTTSGSMFLICHNTTLTTMHVHYTALPGVSSFMIHNTLHSLCLEDFPKTGLVQLNKCNLDSVLQQWIWRDQSLLERVGTSRCLSAHHSNPIQTVPCEGVEDGGHRGDGGLRWGCELNRLISQNSSLELSTDGKRLTLSHRSKQTKWRSLDEGDICQERLSK